MNKQKAIDILKEYQKYRMGEGEYLQLGVHCIYRPKEISEAIEVAIEYMNNN